MKIMIIGGGSVGAIVAEFFSDEGHDVVVVEEKTENVQYLQNNLDVSVVEGNGTDANSLITGGIQDTQLFIALTDIDEINIIACSLAKHFGVAKKIARLNQNFLNISNSGSILKDLGIDEVLKPEDGLVDSICRLVEYPGLMDLQYFMEHNYVIAGFSFNSSSPFYGKSLSEIKLSSPAVILGYSQSSDFQPYNPDVLVNEFLCVYFGCETRYLPAIYRSLLPEHKPINNLMLYGAGFKSKLTSVAIAQRMAELGKHTTIVLDNKKDIKTISSSTETPIMVADPLKFGFARAVDIKNQDYFVAMGDTFENNFFASSIAYNEKVPYITSLVRLPEHVNLISSLPITSFINPATVLANKVMKYHNLDHVVTRTILRYHQVECVEIVLDAEHPLIDSLAKEGSEYGLKRSKVIAVWRNHQLINVEPDTKFTEDDRILLLLDYSEKKLLKNII